MLRAERVLRDHSDTRYHVHSCRRVPVVWAPHLCGHNSANLRRHESVRNIHIYIYNWRYRHTCKRARNAHARERACAHKRQTCRLEFDYPSSKACVRVSAPSNSIAFPAMDPVTAKSFLPVHPQPAASPALSSMCNRLNAIFDYRSKPNYILSAHVELAHAPTHSKQSCTFCPWRMPAPHAQIICHWHRGHSSCNIHMARLH